MLDIHMCAEQRAEFTHKVHSSEHPSSQGDGDDDYDDCNDDDDDDADEADHHGDDWHDAC